MMATRNQTVGGAVALAIAATLSAIYVNEGGYANHAADRGGETMHGITEKVARQWGYTGAMRDFPKLCSPSQPVCADRIYTVSYIDKPGFRPFAAIEPALLDELVDSAVLHGPSKPGGWLQLAMNALCGGAKLKVDGQVGPRTVAAYQNCQNEHGRFRACVMILDRLDDAQLAYFDRIVMRNPSQRVFYRGWTTRRIGNVDRRKCGKGVG